MAAKVSMTDCPHCGLSTPAEDSLCGHCGGLLGMTSVWLAEDCQMSVADGATVGTDDPVILMTFHCHKDGTDQTPVTIAVRAAHVTGLRNGLMDNLMSVGVRLTIGSDEHDEGSADS